MRSHSEVVSITKLKNSAWIKDITKSQDFKVIKTKEYDDYRDFVMDPKGFFLIKINAETQEISVALVDNNTYEIKFEIKGKRAQDLYYPLCTTLNAVSRLDHAAYLGKELARAEFALKNKMPYVQE